MRRREQAEASRAALVAAAHSCFAEDGYDATTVAEILRRAGMARGALYHYFPGGKDELFAVVYREVDDGLYRRVDALPATLPDASPLTLIRESAAVFLRLSARPDFARIVVLEGPRVMAAGSPHGSVLGRSYAAMREGVSAALDAGELAPELAGLDVDVVTTGVYGAIRDLGARVASARNRRRAAEEALVVVDRLLDGLRADARAAVRRTPARTARPTTSDRNRTHRRESA